MSITSRERDAPEERIPDSELLVHERVKAGGILIDPNKSLGLQDDELNRAIGESALSVAGIRMGGFDELLLLDTRNTNRFRSPFLLVNGNDPRERKGLWPDRKVTIGRRHIRDRFTYSDGVSGTHFSLEYPTMNDAILLKDLNSKNGTFFTGYTTEYDPKKPPHLHGIRDDYTNERQLDAEQHTAYGNKDVNAPYGYYNNHAIIGRDSRTMRDGVYGTRSSEQLVVDDKSERVKAVVDEILSRVREMGKSPTMDQRAILEEVRSGVAHTLRYDLDATEKLCDPYRFNKGSIMMSEFIKEGIGVCRHQAVLAALVMESLIDVGLLYGDISVERNHDTEIGGAHAWAVFKSDADDVIVDPAQGFVGTREDAARKNRWRYYVSA